jgi:hypothetical protein
LASCLFFLFCLFRSVAFGALEAVIFAHECTSYPALGAALIIALAGSTNELPHSLFKVVA